MKQGPLYGVQMRAGATFSEREGWQVAAAFQSPDEDFAILNETVGLVDLAGWGVLSLRGRDRLDFVQRMSTNDVMRLKPGQGAPTVFTTPIGRILDLAFVLVREEEVLLVVGRGADEKVAGWLQRHIFFNDDVRVEIVTEEQALIGLTGPGSTSALTKCLGQDQLDLPSYHTLNGQIEGLDMTVMHAIPLGYDYSLLAQADQVSDLWAGLAAGVASVGGAPVGEKALEAARIAAGLPRYGRELCEDYIPLEAGLKWAISFRKGCYVGQEVIARMETYQRLAKRLVILGCERKESPAGLSLTAGDEVRAADAKVGQITSVASLSDGGLVKALAYLKTAVAEPGLVLNVLTKNGPAPAKVLALAGEH